ncbi:MAG: hypothetical protein NTY22_02155 [Proteobacteria bacterium]|nr:hypothetical protein [Pseudomonadota bacterium]
MKIFVVFVSCIIIFQSTIFADTNIDDTKTSNQTSSFVSTAAALAASLNYKKTCTSAKDPLACINTESSLQTAITACKAAAGSSGASNAVSAADAIACNLVKCDASPSTKENCFNECKDKCTTDKTTCDTDCTTTKTSCYSSCGPSAAVGCTGLCDTAYTTCTTKCTSQKTSCDNSCTSSYTGDKPYNPDNQPSDQTYLSCIQGDKKDGGTLQRKCRTLCISQALGESSLFSQKDTLSKTLDDLQKDITGGDGNGNGPPPPITPPIIPPVTPPPTQQDCSNMTGDALAKCSCESLGKTWNSKTGCSDDTTTNNTLLPKNTTPTGTDPSGTGLPSSENSAGTTGSGSSDSNKDVNVPGGADKDKKTGEPSGTGANSGNSSGKGSSTDTTKTTNGEDEESSSSTTGGGHSKIAGMDENIWIIISGIYKGEYDGKKLGFFASIPDEKSDKKSIKKKKVTRK